MYTSGFHPPLLFLVKMSYRLKYGDILNMSDVDCICHQVNCLTVEAHGLSLRIAEKYPFADIYKNRTRLQNRNLATVETRGIPGTIEIYQQSPAVICMLAQYDYGRCNKRYQRSIPPYKDTANQRVQWFQQCLDKIGATSFKRIAFPFKIGCGLAGGDWKMYHKMLKEFAVKFNKDVTIVVYKRFV